MSLLQSVGEKSMSKRAVLDASALLALLSNEPGSLTVTEAIERGACMSAVNAAEVHGKLCDSGMPVEIVEEIIQGLGIDIVDFDAKQASLTGSLRPVTRSAGLSLGDRACLALALKLESAAVTADRTWKEIAVQVDVQVIR
jgi:ribonuclease VapC